MRRLREDDIVRFWAQVDKHGPVVRPELGECWIWTGPTRVGGYGLFLDEGAHRVAWLLAHGSLPSRPRHGLWLLHKCDNPPCVRDSHLYLGDAADNMQDYLHPDRERRHHVAPPGATVVQRPPQAPWGLVRIARDAGKEPLEMLCDVLARHPSYSDAAAELGVSLRSLLKYRKFYGIEVTRRGAG